MEPETNCRREIHAGDLLQPCKLSSLEEKQSPWLKECPKGVPIGNTEAGATLPTWYNGITAKGDPKSISLL